MIREFLIFGFMALFLINPVSAYYSYSEDNLYVFDATFPLTMGPVSSAEADKICVDMGYTGGHYGTIWYEQTHTSAWTPVDSNQVNWGLSKTTSSTPTQYYGREVIKCVGMASFDAHKTRYFAKPMGDFNVTPSVTTGFSPLSVTFTPNVYTGLPLQASHQTWDFGDGNITSYKPNFVPTTLNHVYNNPGTYSVSVTYLLKPANYRNYSIEITALGDDDVNFVGIPTYGASPLPVSFTAYNLSNTTGLSWSFGDGNISSSSTTKINHTYQNQGIYSVRLDFFNSSGISKYIQKNNYITVGAPNATKTKYFQTIDGTNGNIVLNSSIQLNDIENTSWVNATGLTSDGMSHITTLEGHHINAYAQALGFSDADDLNILNDGQPQYIMMWPTFAKNVSAGNVSLYVTVKDKDTKANIVGAGVTASLSTGGVQSTTTNEAGIAYFIVTNNTIALITAQAIGQGYQTATTTINTGTGSGGSASAAATILLGKNTVIPTFQTVTTLPGGGTPTPTITILPGCEDTISAEGQAKCRTAQSNQGLSFLAANMGDLIMICVFVTMLYLLGIKLGR